MISLTLHDYAPVPVRFTVPRVGPQVVGERPNLLCLAAPSPRLPTRAFGAYRAALSAALLHGGIALTVVLATTVHGSVSTTRDTQADRPPDIPRLVFLATPGPGGGGGGGGARQAASASRAQAPGRDRMTVRIATPVIATAQPADVVPPSLVLETKALASGEMMLAGMPDAPPSLFVSSGSGSGGGVGDGRGMGIGDGIGPGLGSGSGGGSGGGVYHLGSGVTPPILIAQPKPRYTADALQRHVQGLVILEAVVGHDGIPYGFRVMRSLDPGLDVEAINAVRNWRFLPGRLGRTPVDVLVTIEIDFHMV